VLSPISATLVTDCEKNTAPQRHESKLKESRLLKIFTFVRRCPCVLLLCVSLLLRVEWKWFSLLSFSFQLWLLTTQSTTLPRVITLELLDKQILSILQVPPKLLISMHVSVERLLFSVKVRFPSPKLSSYMYVAQGVLPSVDILQKSTGQPIILHLIGGGME
jgi:hypothetical protein